MPYRVTFIPGDGALKSLLRVGHQSLSVHEQGNPVRDTFPDRHFDTFE